MSAPFKLEFSTKSYGGVQQVYSFFSKELDSKTEFACYLPPKVVDSSDEKVPVIYFLSGIGGDFDSFVVKSGFQQYAAKYNCIVIGPDTSPRGCNIPGEDDIREFGTGAGFYLDATTELYKRNYRMYSFMFNELFPLVEAHFPIQKDNRSVMGFSMGGHGALLSAMKNPGFFKCVTLFAPLCHPIAEKCVPGVRAFLGYLGEKSEKWNEWDSMELFKKYNGPDLHLRIDQGSKDIVQEFLMTEEFVELYSQRTGQDASTFYKNHEDYDHDYYFVATFMGDHFEHHSKFLRINDQ